MRKRFLSVIGGAAVGLATPTLAYAHPGHEHGGFASGLLHPLTGVDHVLAMVLVGLIAAQIGGRALYLLPLSFVSMMIAGGVLGIAGLPLEYVELGIAASLIIFGLLVATNVRVPLLLASPLTGAFAIFHGYAHGAEMPAGAGGITYVAGFVLATIILHGLGIAGWYAAARFKTHFSFLARLFGGGAAVVGFVLAAAVLP